MGRVAGNGRGAPDTFPQALCGLLIAQWLCVGALLSHCASDRPSLTCWVTRCSQSLLEPFEADLNELSASIKRKSFYILLLSPNSPL